MVGFIIALIFGIIQMLILNKLLIAATSGRLKTLCGMLFIKFITYICAIALLIFKFPDYLINCICGFVAGLPLSAFIYFIYKNIHNKDSASKRR